MRELDTSRDLPHLPANPPGADLSGAPRAQGRSPSIIIAWLPLVTIRAVTQHCFAALSAVFSLSLVERAVVALVHHEPTRQFAELVEGFTFVAILTVLGVHTVATVWRGEGHA